MSGDSGNPAKKPAEGGTAPQARGLRQEDVEPIDLIPVKKSNGKVVYRQLEDCAEKTGPPRQIVCDCGPDVKSGVDEFRLKHETPGTYDMKHKGAAVLKRELNGDPDWLEFVGGPRHKLPQAAHVR